MSPPLVITKSFDKTSIWDTSKKSKFFDFFRKFSKLPEPEKSRLGTTAPTEKNVFDTFTRVVAWFFGVFYTFYNFLELPKKFEKKTFSKIF